MSKFKVGDKVRCVDDACMTYITKGRTYEVLSRVGDAIRIPNDGGGTEMHYGVNRFELANDLPTYEELCQIVVEYCEDIMPQWRATAALWAGAVAESEPFRRFYRTALEIDAHLNPPKPTPDDIIDKWRESEDHDVEQLIAELKAVVEK
jgi:hypothetical protein